MSKYRMSVIAAALAAASATGMVYAQSSSSGGGTASPGPVQAPETDNRDPGAPAGTAGRMGPGSTTQQQADTMPTPGTTRGTTGSTMDDPSLSAADRARIEAEEQRLGRDLTDAERERLLSDRPARADRN